MEQKLFHGFFDAPFAAVIEQIVEKYWFEIDAPFIMAWHAFFVKEISGKKCEEAKKSYENYSSHVIVILVN